MSNAPQPPARRMRGPGPHRVKGPPIWRTIVEMTSLPNYGSLGEKRAEEAASAWGLSDFIYQPVEIPKGGARREIGDRLVWIGNQIIILSVKTRSSPQDSEQRARGWLDKHLAKANRQISGTHRTLRNPPSNLVLRSGRGVEVPWESRSVASYCGVIVVDYDRPIKYEPQLEEIDVPSVAMVADDWELITSTLMSTASLASYIELRATLNLTISLGHEDYILNQVLAAESLGERDKIRSDALIAGRWSGLPQGPSDAKFGSMPDHKYALVVNEMIAGAADQDREFSTLEEAHDYLHIVEFLDRVPPMHRVEFGKAVIKKCEVAGKTNTPQSSLLRTALGPLVFIAHPGPRQARVQALQNHVIARHTQLREALGGQAFTTLGIATEPMPTAGRSHDYVLLHGGFRITDAERKERDTRFGSFPGDVEMFRALRPSSIKVVEA